MAFCDDENNTKSAWLNYEPHVAGGHLVCVARLHWYLYTISIKENMIIHASLVHWQVFNIELTSPNNSCC